MVLLSMGFSEMILAAIVFVGIFAPDKLPVVINWLKNGKNAVKNVSDAVTRTWESAETEVKKETEEIKAPFETIKNDMNLTEISEIKEIIAG